MGTLLQQQWVGINLSSLEHGTLLLHLLATPRHLAALHFCPGIVIFVFRYDGTPIILALALLNMAHCCFTLRAMSRGPPKAKLQSGWMLAARKALLPVFMAVSRALTNS